MIEGLKKELRFPHALGVPILIVVFLFFYITSESIAWRLLYVFLSIIAILTAFERIHRFVLLSIIGTISIIYGVLFVYLGNILAIFLVVLGILCIVVSIVYSRRA
jgi:hypothetical protein